MAQVLVVYKEVQQFLEEFPKNDEDPGETTVSYDEKPGIQAIANITARFGAGARLASHMEQGLRV